MNHPQPEFSLERIEIAVSMQQQVFIPDTKRSDRAINRLSDGESVALSDR